jgi:hypothetical protein
MQEIMRVVPSRSRYAQMACSIESPLDLMDLSIDELSGCLVTSEGAASRGRTRAAVCSSPRRIWRACSSSHQPGSGGSSSGGKQYKDRLIGGIDGTCGGGPSKDTSACKRGHWDCDCRKKKKDAEAQAHHVQEEDDDDPALLMAVRVR